MIDKEEKLGFWAVVLICAIGCSIASCSKSESENLPECDELVIETNAVCDPPDSCDYYITTESLGSKNKFSVNKETFEFYREQNVLENDVCYDGKK